MEFIGRAVFVIIITILLIGLLEIVVYRISRGWHEAKSEFEEDDIEINVNHL